MLKELPAWKVRMLFAVLELPIKPAEPEPLIGPIVAAFKMSSLPLAAMGPIAPPLSFT